MPCSSSNSVSYTEPKFPNCPIPDACGICRLLNNGKFSLQDHKVDTEQTVFTFKKIRDSQNNLIFPLTPTESELINQNCYQAILKSCQGEEPVGITSYDILNGKITLERGFNGSLKFNHEAPITLDFGVFTVDMANKTLDILCELYTRFCSTYPECATPEMSGIGKASFVDPANQGKCPTFITTQDPRWQILITKFGLEDDTSDTGILSELLVFLNQPSNCDGEIKNKDVLEEMIRLLCGKVECVVKVVDILCDVLEEIKVGNNVRGINFADRFISADFGVKPLLLHRNRNTGTINDQQTTSYIAPAQSFDGNVLVEDLTGKGGVNGFTVEKGIDIQTISLPVRGKLQFSGYLSAGYNQGLFYPRITISSGATTIETIILNPVDNTGSDRGDSYGSLSAPISSISLDHLTNNFDVGTYQAQLDFIAILPPNKSTDKSVAVYAWDWNIIFIPA